MRQSRGRSSSQQRRRPMEQYQRWAQPGSKDSKVQQMLILRNLYRFPSNKDQRLSFNNRGNVSSSTTGNKELQTFLIASSLLNLPLSVKQRQACFVHRFTDSLLQWRLGFFCVPLMCCTPDGIPSTPTGNGR